jgi:hypothetical protein
VTDPAWPDVLQWIKAATNTVELLPADQERRDDIRRAVGVSLESALGAVIHETGGILVDHGWLRILGSGSPRLPRVARPDRRWILIADDAVGGFFALHPPEGKVRYLAPDTLEWEDLGIGYSAWLRWCLSEDSARFSIDYRGVEWRRQVASLAPHQCFHIAPPPFTEGPPFPDRSWKAVPVSEIYEMTLDFQKQLEQP